MGNTMFAEPNPSSLLASYFAHSRKVFRANSHRILLPQHLAPYLLLELETLLARFLCDSLQPA